MNDHSLDFTPFFPFNFKTPISEFETKVLNVWKLGAAEIVFLVIVACLLFCVHGAGRRSRLRLEETGTACGRESEYEKVV